MVDEMIGRQKRKGTKTLAGRAIGLGRVLAQVFTDETSVESLKNFKHSPIFYDFAPLHTYSFEHKFALSFVSINLDKFYFPFFLQMKERYDQISGIKDSLNR